MTTPLRKTVKGADLPPEWAEEAGARADGEYTVTIEAANGDARLSNREFLKRCHEEAAANGMTPEKLKELLASE